MRPLIARSHVSHPQPAASSRLAPRPRLNRLVLAAAVSVTLVGCGQLENDGLTSAAVGAPSIGFDVAGLVEVMVAPPGPDAAADFLASLPTPHERAAREVVNRHHPGRVDQIVTLTYPGVEVQVYQASEPAKQLPAAVRLTRSDAAYRGLRVGMRLAEAEALLAGATELPATPDGASFLVDDPAAAPHRVDVASEDGTVTALTFSAHLD